MTCAVQTGPSAAGALDLAREVLPRWVVWAPVLSALVAALLAAALGAAAIALTSRPLRALPAEAHWTERARLAWPVRRAVAAFSVLGVAVAGPLTLGGPLSRPGLALRILLSFAGAMAGALAAGFAAENRLVRPLPAAVRLRSVATWLLLMFPGYAAALGFCLVAGASSSSISAVLAGQVVVLIASLGGAFRLARLVGLVRPPPPRLSEALGRIWPAGSGPPPRLWVLRIASANALALPALRAIGATEGALACLDDDGLSAVLAHELGHLAEPRRVLAARVAAFLLPPMALAAAPLVAQASPWGLPLLLLAVFGGLRLFRPVHRVQEQRADAAAHGHGATYATALESLHRYNLLPAVLGRSASHPDLYDRMVAAGVTPAWERPARPSSGRALLVVVSILAGLVLSLGTLARARVARGDGLDRGRLLLALAVQGDAWDAGRLALWHANRAELVPAASLYGAAEAIEPDEPAWPGSLAITLAQLGRCEEAAAALARATAFDAGSPYVMAAQAVTARCDPGPGLAHPAGP